MINSLGEIRITAKNEPAAIEKLKMDDGMGLFTAPFSPPSLERKALARIAAEPEADVILAVDARSSVIVGFIAIGKPSPSQRWSRLAEKGLLEALAIEVSVNWRHQGIANAMMRTGLRDPRLDEKIVMCTGFSWHWDMDGESIAKEKYRVMLLRYLEKAGFKYFDTDDPNVMLDPVNFLTARIGIQVPGSLYEAFQELLFVGTTPDYWREPREITEVLAGEV